MDASSKGSGTELKPGWLSFALAIAVGLVGANAFADAAGFPQYDMRESVGPFFARALAGLVLFFLTFTLVKYLFSLGARLVSLFGATGERPTLPVTMTILVCGTLCVLGALGLSLLDARSSANIATPTISLPGAPNMPQMGDMRISGSLNVGGSSISALVRPLVTLLTLLVGAALLAVGVWSGLKPAGLTVAGVDVPHAPEPAAS
jgi:hypothetical protein